MSRYKTQEQKDWHSKEMECWRMKHQRDPVPVTLPALECLARIDELLKDKTWPRRGPSMADFPREAK